MAQVGTQPASAAVTADIRDLAHDGRGIADIDGRRVFVAGALPSERVLVAPRRRRRRHGEADLVDVVTASAERVEAPCPYFGRCGGCALQHLAYDAQLQFKQRVVAQAFSRIAGIEPAEWLDPVTGPQWGYRRRARLGVKYVDAKQRVLVGFRERAAPYVTDMSHCPVLTPPLGDVLGPLAEVIAASTIKRRLPQVEAAAGDAGGALVLRVLDAPSAADEAAFAAFGSRWDLDVYLQPGGPGTAAPLAAAPRALEYALRRFAVKLRFAPTDFIQVNGEVNEKMVGAAVDAAALERGDRVLDLFCGLGNFSLPLATRGAVVVGVDGDAGLIGRAASNARLNGIDNAEFCAADLTDAEVGVYRQRWDVVVLDPPRSGAAAVVGQMRRIGARRVVYVSCHPATLARDAKVLVETQGYRLQKAGIFDMFPHTHHVEAMACFERND